METHGMQRRLSAIMSADVVAYSRLMAGDEEGTLARLKGHREELFEPAIAERHKKPQQRNEQWAAIPASYIKHLRAAAAHYREKMPEDAPKGSILRWAKPIQKRAFETTFEDIDLNKLEAAWIEAIKAW